MNNYELIVLLHPDLEIDIDTPIAKIEKLIEGADGKVIKRDNWGKKRLSYSIKKHDFAVYVYFKLQLDGSAIESLEKSLGITEEVIRHLLVKVPESKPTKAKAVATAKEE